MKEASSDKSPRTRTPPNPPFLLTMTTKIVCLTATRASSATQPLVSQGVLSKAAADFFARCASSLPASLGPLELPAAEEALDAIEAGLLAEVGQAEARALRSLLSQSTQAAAFAGLRSDAWPRTAGTVREMLDSAAELQELNQAAA